MRTIKITTATTLVTSVLMLLYATAATAHDGPVFEEEQTSSPMPYIAAGLLLGLVLVGGVFVVLKKKGGHKISPEIGSMVDSIEGALEGIEDALKSIEENIDKHIYDENEHNK